TPDRLCLFSLWSSIVSYTNSFPTRRSSDLRETRLCLLGPLQRGGQPTTFDRVLATQFGAHAVRLIVQERFGEMICSRPPEMTSVPIREAVHKVRQVDPQGPGVLAARALGISFGDRPAGACVRDVFAHCPCSESEPAGGAELLEAASSAVEMALAD